MELTAWRTYLAVCRLGSLSGAAVELEYTQSAVSRQVATLERLVGVPLLVRGARGVVPTPAGEAFHHHARMVVAEADRGVRAAREVGIAPHPVAIGATPSVAAGVVSSALRRVHDTQPDLVWTLIPGLTPGLTEAVLNGELDLAVVTDAPPGLPNGDRVALQPVGVDRMCVLVPEDHPAAADDAAVSLAEFAGAIWVEDNEGSAALLRTAAARAGFEPRIDLAAADLTGKTAMVAAGHAVALIPGVLRRALRRDVVAVQLADPPTRGIYAITPPVSATGHAHRVVTEVIDAIRAELLPD